MTRGAIFTPHASRTAHKAFHTLPKLASVVARLEAVTVPTVHGVPVSAMVTALFGVVLVGVYIPTTSVDNSATAMCEAFSVCNPCGCSLLTR